MSQCNTVSSALDHPAAIPWHREPDTAFARLFVLSLSRSPTLSQKQEQQTDTYSLFVTVGGACQVVLIEKVAPLVTAPTQHNVFPLALVVRHVKQRQRLPPRPLGPFGVFLPLPSNVNRDPTSAFGFGPPRLTLCLLLAGSRPSPRFNPASPVPRLFGRCLSASLFRSCPGESLLARDLNCREPSPSAAPLLTGAEARALFARPVRTGVSSSTSSNASVSLRAVRFIDRSNDVHGNQKTMALEKKNTQKEEQDG